MSNVKCLNVLGGVCLTLLGCVSKDIAPPIEPLSPDEVSQSINKLANQSFEFTIKFNKPSLKGDFRGITSEGKAKVEGIWEFDGDREKFVGIGIGENEYKFENGKWEVRQRTQNTDPIATLKLVCSMGGYRFKGIEGDNFLYEFDSNLLFMAPQLFDITTRGLLWLNTKTGLPQKVIAEADNIEWKFEVQSIGEKYEIVNPLATIHRLEIISGTNCDASTQTIADILKHRFELYGFSGVKYEIKKSSIFLEFLNETKNHLQDLIHRLTQPGKIELKKATYATGNSGALRFVGNDPTKPVFLGESIECSLTNINFQPGVKSVIELVFDKNLPEDWHIAVVVDGEVITVVPKAWGNKFAIEGDKLTWIKIKLHLPCKIDVKN